MAKTGKIKIQFSPDDAELFRELKRMEDKYGSVTKAIKEMGRASDKVSTTAKKTGRELRTTGKAGDDAFGKQALAKVTAYAGGMLSVAAGGAKIIQMFSELKQLREEAGMRIQTPEQGRRALKQVAETQDQYDRLIATVRRLRTEHGFVTEDAQTLTFAAASAGDQFVRQIDLLGRLKDIGFEPTAGVTAAQKMQSIFGGAGAGAAGGGTLRQVINKVLAAAGPSPVLASAIARSVAVAGVGFRRLGGEDEDLLAAIAVLSEPYKTPERAAERIKTLAATVATKRKMGLIDVRGYEGLKGLDLLRALPELGKKGRLMKKGAKGPVSVELLEFLGGMESIEALEALQTMAPQIRKRAAAVKRAEATTGGPQDIFAQRLAISDPQLVAARRQRIATQKRQLTEEKRFGSAALMAQALKDELAEQKRARGTGEGRIWAAEKLWGAWSAVYGDAAMVRQFGPLAGPEFRKDIRKWRGGLAAQVVGPGGKIDRSALRAALESGDLGELVGSMPAVTIANMLQRREELVEQGPLPQWRDPELRGTRDQAETLRILNRILQVLEQTEQKTGNRTMKPANVDEGAGVK